MRWMRGWILAGLFLGAYPVPGWGMDPLFGLPSPLVGRPAPDFTLPDLDGERVNFRRWQDGRRAVLFFWATWCPHCREQIRVLADKRDQIERKGVRVLLVDVQESSGRVARFLEGRDLEMEVLLDATGEVSGAYGVVGIPTFVFIDETGTVRDVRNIYLDPEDVFSTP